MSTINRLSSVDVLQPGDQIPVWDSSNGDTRKASMSTLLAFVESYFADPDYSTRIVAPAVDYFTVDIGATGDSIWMIVNPTLNFTNGAITLPPASSAVNDQEITVVFTAAVSTFVITSAGATVLGAPVQIGGYDSFRVRYNAAQLTWYTLDTTGDGTGSGVSQIVRQDFTGDGTTTTFTLTTAPSALGNELQIFIDGVYQERSGYTVTGSNIIFSEAPPSLSTIEVLGWSVTLGAETTSDLVSYTAGATGSVLTTVQAKLRESVSVVDFGADPTGVTECSAAINAALNSLPINGGSLEFPTGTYLVTSPIVIPVGAKYFRLTGYGATLNCAHNGDGLVAISTNENYSSHTIEGFRIVGPNTFLPGTASPVTSTGSGISMARGDTSNTVASYNCAIRDVVVQGFNKGLTLQSVIDLSVTGKTLFEYNQYGIYIDAGQTNANTFIGVHVRYNRVAGIYSSGRSGGTLTNATQNQFISCLIESNIFYDITLYPPPGNGTNPDFVSTPEIGGVVLLNSYDFSFYGCYFENHNFGIWLGASSDGHRFENCFFSPSGAHTGGIMIADNGCVNNTFTRCSYAGGGALANVKMLGIFDRTTAKNSFVDCAGWVFQEAVDQRGGNISSLNIRYASTNQAGGGDTVGLLQLPGNGYTSNVSVGTTRGTIDTTTASATVLNADGFGEIQLGNGVAEAITITEISNVRPNSYFVLTNYQVGYPVTVASGAIGTGLIYLKDGHSAVMTDLGDTIVFWVTGQSKLKEVGRTFSSRLKGTATHTGAVTVTAVVFPFTLQNNSYRPFLSVDTKAGTPASDAWKLSVGNLTATGFNIYSEAAPGVGNTLYVNWVIEPTH